MPSSLDRRLEWYMEVRLMPSSPWRMRCAAANTSMAVTSMGASSPPPGAKGGDAPTPSVPRWRSRTSSRPLLVAGGAAAAALLTLRRHAARQRREARARAGRMLGSCSCCRRSCRKPGKLVVSLDVRWGAAKWCATPSPAATSLVRGLAHLACSQCSPTAGGGRRLAPARALQYARDPSVFLKQRRAPVA
jgi:hypothetical protein